MSGPLSRGLVDLPGKDHSDDSLALMLEAGAARLPDEARLRESLAQREGIERDLDPNVPLDVILHRFKHRNLVRIGLFDLGHQPNPHQIGAALSGLADVIVRRMLLDLRDEYVRAGEEGKAAPPFTLAVFALGKHGMGAMDYGSDLDLSFVFQPHADEPAKVREHPIRVARRLIARIEDRSRGGRLFEVDMRLRPSGNQGLLVSSFSGFATHHAGGSPVWERLALIRMRCVAEIEFAPGSSSVSDSTSTIQSGELGRRVLDEIVHAAIVGSSGADSREDAAIIEAVRTLKRRVEKELARETRELLNPKTGVGGCLEAELLVGALQLMNPGSRPARRISDAIEQLVSGSVLSEAQGRELARAYRFERRLLNRLRMMQGTKSSSEPDRFAVNSPRLDALARRMALPTAAALVGEYLDMRTVVRDAFDLHLPEQ